MTSDRPYSPGMTTDGAVAELRRCADTQFDRAVVEAFCRALRQTGVSAETAGAV
jgi:HD-GYP domain-containing protein (c-di-GMP phosphodiesterase class II)